jgi:hypothetical protein
MSRKFPQDRFLLPDVVLPTTAMSTNAVHYMACPRCGAEPGFMCVSKAGKLARWLPGGAHNVRMLALHAALPEVAALSVVARP